jgi:excinuclease ABC subunit C
VPFDPADLNHFPLDAGVYLMKDEAGKILYIGKAKKLRQRVKQYFQPGRDGRPMVPFLTAQIASIDPIVVPTEKEALLLENTLIKKHKPKYNALLKDDKTFISLIINHKHPWPMIRVMRCKAKPKQDVLYFGPYTNAYAARQTLELLNRLFPLRQCSDQELKRRKRPCILYSIKRCIAPCVGKCSKEEYALYVKEVIRFLKGQNKEVTRELKEAMERAAQTLEFEKADMLLKTIEHIEQVQESKAMLVKGNGRDTDALGLFRKGHEVMVVQLLFREGNLVGSQHYFFSKVAEEDNELISSFLLQHYASAKLHPEEILLPSEMNCALLSELLFEATKARIHLHTPKKGDKLHLVHLAEKNAKVLFEQEKAQMEQKEKLLLDLQESLHLSRYPRRIECFDTSHISGSDLVASMIAFTDGKKDAARTRLFRIKEIDKGDDYGSLHQVLLRRLTRAKQEDDLPDLIVVDGGKGQLRVALDVLKELDVVTVSAIALAKEEGRHDKGMTKERVFIPEKSEPIVLDSHSPLLFFLQKLRDEAHAKAIGFHKKRRSKRLIPSSEK